jgi:Ner family transcriptional regulator
MPLGEKLRHNWDWPDIKSELEKRGITLSSLAEQLEVSPQAVSKVKKRSSHRVQNAIAKALQKRPENIWPERYRASRAA